MADLLRLEIVTPEGKVHWEHVHMVLFPASEGHIGVLPRHAPLTTHLVPGEIIVHAPTEDRYLVVGEGLVEIGADHVTVVTDMAVPVERVDEAKVEEQRLLAEARLREELDDDEMASVTASLTRLLVQLQAKRRHRA